MPGSIPKTYKQWCVTNASSFDQALKTQEKPMPQQLGSSEVLVKFKAAALNFRDLIITRGEYPFGFREGVVPASDGAGEVISVGPSVTLFKPGDHVTTLFNQAHQHGPISETAINSGVGARVDGALREYGVYPETGLVRAPKNLSFEEAATLPCAALTAWNALYGLKPLKPGECVLVQGTSGVSIFALQFAKAAGAFVIATTSTPEKAELLKSLGADKVINYTTTPNWGSVAKQYRPVHIIEIGGPNTIPQSLEAIDFEGVISVIGFVAGTKGKQETSPLEVFNRICIMRGILVGSKEQMEAMVKAIEVNNIKPVIDKRVFGFAETKEAYKYQWDRKHVGKVVIRINE